MSSFGLTPTTPNPDDVDTYIANVRDKILRFRNDLPSPYGARATRAFHRQKSENKLQAVMTELEPTRYYQANSNSGGEFVPMALTTGARRASFTHHQRLLQD